ncbi:MAG: glycosyltransferase family 2 protein [Nitrospinae bacterium]|nr:glycosyltransferase family 2 protein [Nitrospinota bacterium]
MKDSVEVSVVIPVYNEELVLREFYPRLKKEADGWGRSYELVFVDDGSTDGSFELIREWKASDPTLRLVKFTRNFGQQAAVLAGFRHCRGDIVVQIDADLQNPPEEISKLLNAFTDEVELVVSIPSKRRDNPLRVLGSKFLHCFARSLFGSHMKLNLSSFRAMRRSVIEKVDTCSDRSRYMAVLMSWMGLPTVEVEVEHHVRRQGKTKYGFLPLVKLSWDLITGYSTLPLRLVTYLGLLGAVMGFATMLFLLYQRMVAGILIEGFVVLSAAFAFFAGVQLLSIGFLGEYLGRVHLQIQNRPDYIIHKVID